MNDNKHSGGFRNKLSVLKENNPSALIFMIIILINIISIIFSSVILRFLPENEGRTIPQMLRAAFTLMVNPSGRYVYSDAPVSLVITTFVVLFGMISLTGGTVGYITSMISGVIEKSACSKNKLKLKNHIVILNYNHKVSSLICDYCFDDIENTYIVILSEREKDEIQKQIDDAFAVNGIKKKFKNVIIRKGNPMSQTELDNISAHSAKTVLIMTPENETEHFDRAYDESNSFAVSKLFMFISWYFEENSSENNTNIIVEAADKNVEDIVRDHHRNNNGQICVPVNFNEILGKIMAVTSLMPALNDALLHMISFEGVELYLKDIPDSLSISEDLKRQNSAIPLFDIGKKRAYLAEDESAIHENSNHQFKMNKQVPEKELVPLIRFEKNEIIIIGINSKLPYILESLVCFKNEHSDSNLHVTLMDSNENREALEKYYADQRYSSVLSPETSEPVIIDSIFDPSKNISPDLLKKMNSMLFLSDDTSMAAHIDEKPLIFWSKLKNTPDFDTSDCIVEILDMQNKDIIKRKNNDQVIVSDKFLSCMYAQLGKDPLRLNVIKDMVTFEGDSASKNIDSEFQNDCDLLAVKAKYFFENNSDIPEFSSKKEMILWIYEATGHKYMPLGCIKNGINYLFARTENNSDGLESAILLSKDSSVPAFGTPDKLTLKPDDEIIVIKSN